MTSPKQIEANRRNAFYSTGPRTDSGKRRSRCNAVRHGLTAETVIGGLEDSEDYKAFELAITSDFDARTAVERELVLRLASLLWRLRRSTAIETGLLQIQSEILRDVRQNPKPRRPTDEYILRAIAGFKNSSTNPSQDNEPDKTTTDDDPSGSTTNIEIGRCFLRLANLDNGAFERLSRYETALWRQIGQSLYVLKFIRRSISDQKTPRLLYQSSLRLTLGDRDCLWHKPAIEDAIAYDQANHGRRDCFALYPGIRHGELELSRYRGTIG